MIRKICIALVLCIIGALLVSIVVQDARMRPAASAARAHQ